MAANRSTGLPTSRDSTSKPRLRPRRQRWKPLAQVAVDEPTRLYGPHVLLVVLRDDQLDAFVDGEIVLTVGALSRESINVGRSPCSGDRVGVQAWSTTDVTVSKLRVGYYD